MRWMPNLRWFGRRAPARPHEIDPADLGTAFGLEASLEDGGDWHSPPSGSFPLESEQAPAPYPPMWLGGSHGH